MADNIKYSSDGLNPSFGSMSNVTERLVDKNVINQSPSAANLYPSSASYGGDIVTNPTQTREDFVLSMNIMLNEIWQLSKVIPGIFQSMSSGAAPSSASGQPTNISTTETAYLTQLQSLKYNTCRRHIDRLLPVMKRFRDNIAAVNITGNQAPNTPNLYPSDQQRGY